METANVDSTRRSLASWLASLGILALAGCGGGVSIYIGDDDDDVSVSYNFVSGYDARVLPNGNYVFRSQADLDRTWSASPPYPSGPAVPGAAPRFDFGGGVLVAIAVGVGPLCDRPRLVGLDASGSTLTVSFRTERDTAAGCTRTGPLQLFVAVPAWSGDVQFRRLGG